MQNLQVNATIVTMTRRNTYDFRSFYAASDRDFRRALEEIRSGAKRSHWIWYVFPQLEILGQSETAIHFGIKNVREAVAYLQDAVLGPRLVEISEAVLERLSEGVELKVLMGSSIDAFKLRSSVTLFDIATKHFLPEYNGSFRKLTLMCNSELKGEDLRTIKFCELDIADKIQLQTGTETLDI